MDAKVQKAKNKLIELGYTDNEYLDKYLEMLELNIDSPRIIGRTQGHHAIPTSSYCDDTEVRDTSKSIKLADSDNINFKVNLLYKDHLKIHSYLTLCTDLDKAQERYEAQADIRKRNSQIGLSASNFIKKKPTKNVLHNVDKQYLLQHYSVDEVEEILNL